MRNPLNESIVITELRANATYHGSQVGKLTYDYPITLRGDGKSTETTRLPVAWSFGGMGKSSKQDTYHTNVLGFEAVKRALGGTLKVNATAVCQVAVGSMNRFTMHLELKEVGASVKI